MVGIIDIGSNTIRLVIYKNGEKLSNTAVNSEILHDTVNGHLTVEGTQKLCEAIEYLKNEAKYVPVYAIATFAFRVLDNCEEVKREIFEKTGVNVDILSGKDEAKCDFNALISMIGEKETGIGVDLGGGSGQIFSFDNGELKFFDSYPIGAKKVKKIFVESVMPTKDEDEKLKKYIRKYVSRVEDKSKILYFMGGTAKTAIRIYNFMKGTYNLEYIETKELENVVKFIEEVPADTMKNILKSRYDNITCGIIVMDEIAKQVEAERIYVLPCGVREGYLAMRGIE